MINKPKHFKSHTMFQCMTNNKPKHFKSHCMIVLYHCMPNKLKTLSVIAEEGAWMHVGIKTAATVSSQVCREIFFMDISNQLKWTMTSITFNITGM